MYAASEGSKDMNWLAGSYCHSDAAFGSHAVPLPEFGPRSCEGVFKGRTEEYM